ncbi:MAG: VCBS repeat-containing protein, partial [Bacteroidota bacterium]
MRRILLLGALSILLLNPSCTTNQAPGSEGKLFTTIEASSSGIDFENKLVETEEANYYKYMYSYIGGGVAAADFNNDGLDDLFFVSNSFDNKLYLNQGSFEFADITQEAGIEKRPGFDAGVSVADVNNDGWLDIYITRGGWKTEDDAFANMLYLNDGPSADGKGISFTESAAARGLADDNRSIQATFFDYDKDGDLDVFVSNTPDFEDRAAKIVDLVAARTDPETIALKGSDRLYNNDGTGHFTEVSEQAGIYPDIGFGLNPQVGDLNNDGWLDIYVCNDFKIPDFAYLNNQDGTFREGRNELFKHISFNSMGSDIADLDNDGLPDLYTLDMNPEDYVRSKTTMGMTQQSRFEEMVAMDYHHQYMHNMLQINNGNGSFREVANLSGVANTDWSWSALLADFDLDGYNDVFVTNGVYRDVIDRDANNKILENLRSNPRKPSDQDFLNFIANDETKRAIITQEGVDFKKLVEFIPIEAVPNYMFVGGGNLEFANQSE